jgi:hypothetical protein
MKFTDSSKCFLKNERKGVLRCADWARWDSTKRASPCKKRSKTFKNSTETFKNYTKTIPKHSKTIRKYSTIFYLYAHLIEILLRSPRGAFINQGLPKLTQTFFRHGLIFLAVAVWFLRHLYFDTIMYSHNILIIVFAVCCCF